MSNRVIILCSGLNNNCTVFDFMSLHSYHLKFLISYLNKLNFCFSVNVDHSEIPSKKQRLELDRPKKKEDKATDDYHYEKFKKQFRR